MALALRVAYPRAALVHWCFDLYPEAIEAEGQGLTVRLLAPVARRLMSLSYRAFDGIVDLGPRMQVRLAAYRSGVDQETLVPWALAEAEHPWPPMPHCASSSSGTPDWDCCTRGALAAPTISQPFLAAGASVPRAIGRRHFVLFRGARLPGGGAAARRHAGRHQCQVRAVRRRERPSGAPRGRRRSPPQPAPRVDRHCGAVKVLWLARRGAPRAVCGPRRLRGRGLDRPA